MAQCSCKPVAALLLCLAALGSAGVSRSSAQSPDSSTAAQFKAIYTADAAWRRAQRGEADDDNNEKILPTLPKVDPASQQARLAHFSDVINQLDALKVDDLSPADKVNFRIYRNQLVIVIHNQKFRDYEMPVNSDSSFWGNEALVVQSPFK